MPPPQYKHYRRLKAFISTTQSKIHHSPEHEYDGDIEVDRENLVRAQWKLRTFEDKYEHIFDAIRQAQKGRS